MFLSQTTFEELTPELLKKHKHRKLVLFGSLFIGLALGIAFFIFACVEYGDRYPMSEWVSTFFQSIFNFPLFAIQFGCGIYYCRVLFKKTYLFIKKVTGFILVLPILGWIFVFCMGLVIPLMVVFYAAMFSGWFFALRDIISLIRRKPMIYKGDLQGQPEV